MKLSREDLRSLIDEEIKHLMQDDVVFKQHDLPGILDDFDDTSVQDSGRNLSYGHTKASDHEGRSTKKQLYYMFRKSQSLYDMLNDDDDLPEWVQSKVSRAADKINSVYEYLEYKIKSSNY
jgi:hypothetical protein|tara:strand:- start:73 stop:435 length:363 start_codon:yes stop_codon:yes gene_type:complete